MAYIGKSPTGTGVRSRYYYTATGGETSLSGADDNSNTLVFSDGNYVDVSLNGIALVAGTDYNTSTANTIGGLSALSASDIVEVVVYDIFTVADTVSAKDGGTFSGNVTMGGNLIATAGASANAISLQSSNFKMTDLTSNAFYRTGTWTPILSDSTATTTGATIHTGTPQIQQGYYVRIGDFVSVHWQYKTPSSAYSYTNGSTGNGQLQWHGLPFKIHAQANFNPVASCGFFNDWSGWGTSYTPMGNGINNTSYVECVYAHTDGDSGLFSTNHSTTNSESSWSMHYITDDA